MEFFILWIGCGIAAAVVAGNKGRNAAGWFILGFFFGPIALIVALVLSKAGPANDERKCPFCAEFIKSEAKVCKHCGRDIKQKEIVVNMSKDCVETDNNLKYQTGFRQAQNVPLDRWRIKQTKEAGIKITFKRCPACGEIHNMKASICKSCGWKPTNSD